MRAALLPARSSVSLSSYTYSGLASLFSARFSASTSCRHYPFAPCLPHARRSHLAVIRARERTIQRSGQLEASANSRGRAEGRRLATTRRSISR
eukprot:5599268-Pyramimonas_sp.AAC.1